MYKIYNTYINAKTTTGTIYVNLIENHINRLSASLFVAVHMP